MKAIKFAMRRFLASIATSGVIFLIVGLTGCTSIQEPEQAGFRLISIDAHERALRGELKIVDIRPLKESISDKRPVNSLSAPFVPQQLNIFLSDIEKITQGDLQAPLALICRSGMNSLLAQRILTNHGYLNIYSVDGGFLGNFKDPGWLAWALPTE